MENFPRGGAPVGLHFSLLLVALRALSRAFGNKSVINKFWPSGLRAPGQVSACLEAAFMACNSTGVVLAAFIAGSRAPECLL
ncbi:hypothetical protein BaRGS_00014484 [Batillaria attramentaria]|uniref:Secreted protein n=1 Tax=Batillaria attramentaria TaxID=370345 RepID=A0ABD0L570_9CAEN